MNSPKNQLIVAYFGRKGGGNNLNLDFANAFSRLESSFEITFAVSSQNEHLNLYKKNDGTIVFNSFGLLVPFTIRSFRKLVSRAKSERFEKKYLLITMYSPKELFFVEILRLFGYKVIRIIHDSTRHPGDRRPFDWEIRRQIKQADQVICLSKSVAEKIAYLSTRKPIVFAHPVIDFRALSSGDHEDSGYIKFKPYILFVGRIRDYKGLDRLLDAYCNSLDLQNMNLVIAGEGRIEHKKIHPRIFILNKWLKEAEIVNLISDAAVIVFPYTESSQSGLIPYVISEGKVIVITPLQGLREQTSDYKFVVEAKDFNSDSLAEAIKVSLSLRTDQLKPAGESDCVESLLSSVIEKLSF